MCPVFSYSHKLQLLIACQLVRERKKCALFFLSHNLQLLIVCQLVSEHKSFAFYNIIGNRFALYNRQENIRVGVFYFVPINASVQL